MPRLTGILKEVFTSNPADLNTFLRSKWNMFLMNFFSVPKTKYKKTPSIKITWERIRKEWEVWFSLILSTFSLFSFYHKFVSNYSLKEGSWKSISDLWPFLVMFLVHKKVDKKVTFILILKKLYLQFVKHHAIII